jgi:iron(III) transport system ATP-binding protein
VTHDPAEALAVADQVSIINAGRIVQTGPPEELHARPTTSLAARVLGDSNLLAGDAADGAVSTALGPLQLDSGSPAGPVTVLVRPTQILIHPDESPGTIPARVLRSEFRGEDYGIELEVGGIQQPVIALGHSLWAPDSEVHLEVRGSAHQLAD